ncbi:MAG: hypothetical protein E7174_03275 [Firmicutes bacterium]|nr:hypothetical protein [Bacillota bacterium]
MENVKIISDNGVEIEVNGLFYIYNSKYYFIYTIGEIDENEYVKLYVVQVGKEVQNTPTGPVDTGYMLGMEISNIEEWAKVQESITKIVENKKNNTQNNEIQYLPINMLVNLKIVSKNKFKLMRHIIEDNFKVNLSPVNFETVNDDINVDTSTDLQNEPVLKDNHSFEQDILNLPSTDNADNVGEVIIDYRARFFEEQEKNQALEEQIKSLNEKLNNIKNIIG